MPGEIALLYELSLVVGSSLNARENTEHFLAALTRLKGLTSASVWLGDGEQPGKNCKLFYSYPQYPTGKSVFPKNHFVLNMLQEKRYFSISSKNPAFARIAGNRTEKTGALAIFKLGAAGMLIMHDAKRFEAFPNEEMEPIIRVVEKFGISLSACFANEKLNQEIINRRNSQQVLHKVNKQYSELFDGFYNAMIIFERDGSVAECNKAALQLTDYALHEQSQMNIWNLIHPDDKVKALRYIKILLRTGILNGLDLRILTRNGICRHISINAYAYFIARRFGGARTMIFDITKQKNTEHQIKLSETYLRQIIDSSLDAVVTIDGNGYITEWNRTAMEMFGYSRSEAIGENISELIIPPRYREAHRQGMKHFHRTGEGPVLNTRIEMPAIRRDGREFMIELTIVPTKQHNSHFFSGFIRDITSQKIKQEKLMISQIRLANLIPNLQSAILLEDENRRIALTNSLFCEYFKIPIPPDQLVGADCSQAAEQSKHLFAEPDVFVAGVKNILALRQIKLGEILKMADGHIFERDYIPLFFEEKYLGHLWQYRDITEKVKTQEAIQNSEEKYRGIIENMQLGMAEIDLDGVIKKPYQYFCEMMGYEPEEIIGRNGIELMIPENHQDLLKYQLKLRAEGSNSVYETQIRRKDGTLIWAIVSAAPIKDRNGQVSGSIFILFDITDRKKMEDALAEAKLIAEHARYTERQFLANMSHEIRTPMNAVIGMTHLLYETNPTQSQKVYLDSLRFAADSLMGIIDNVLDLSKIEAGEMEFEQKDFILQQMLKSLQRSFQFKLRDKAISIDLMEDPSIEYRIIGDPTRLNQILTNLLSNASKFTEKGSICISSKLLGETPKEYLIEFRIEDTGIGIPKNKLGDIFENFKQADVKIARKYGGSGLGLTIVKQLVELQGGSIKVESEIGVGSTFIFTLPFKKSDVRVSEQQQEYRIRQSGSKNFLKTLSILVVEDNLMNQKLITKILDIWNCTYQVANDGLEALQISQSEAFDLILMDIHMPEMDGCEATEKIRKNPANSNRNVPIIALTAAALLEEKKRAVKAGMSDFLTKPFSPEMLEACILQHLKFTNQEQNEMINEIDNNCGSSLQVDLNYLFEFSNNDRMFVLDMIDTFLAEAPVNASHLAEAAGKKDWQAAYKAVHKMKPNFMMLGMTEQHESAMEIENLISKGDFDENDLAAKINWLAACVKKAAPVLEQMKLKV